MNKSFDILSGLRIFLFSIVSGFAGMMFSNVGFYLIKEEFVWTYVSNEQVRNRQSSVLLFTTVTVIIPVIFLVLGGLLARKSKG